VTSTTDPLTEARERIQELEQSLRTAQEELQFFVYAASHDLQQPLRAINTHTQMLLRQCADQERTKEITSVIQTSVAQMNALITSLVAYSRQTSAADRAYVRLNVPLDYAIYKLTELIKASGAKVTARELPEVLGDEAQLTTLFENLITNAIKFRGAEPPEIEVSSEGSDDYHLVSVRDNGCGIHADYHETVFLPFKRLHGRNIPGSGLGLSLCRKIVGAHDGRIWVESDGKMGTTVKFTLPQA
jgi:light-regulated signal transduction histidine kinase (bacteriophytochrome)